VIRKLYLRFNCYRGPCERVHENSSPATSRCTSAMPQHRIRLPLMVSMRSGAWARSTRGDRVRVAVALEVIGSGTFTAQDVAGFKSSGRIDDAARVRSVAR
jgi:hypothetical protein